MAETIQKEYEKLKSKFDLPDFKVLDNEFEISAIEKPVFLLRNIRRKIFERLGTVAEFLDPLFQPNMASAVNMQEYKCISDSERIKLFGILQKIMILYNEIRDAGLACDEKEDARAIKITIKDWPEIRKELRPFIQRLISCWKKSSEPKEITGYFG